MKTPGKMKLPKWDYVKKYQEEAVEMEISQLTIDPEFQKQQQPNPSVKKRILESMRKEGYHKNKPVIVVKLDGKLVLVDGHQRRECALEVGLTKIWVVIRRYDGRADALRAAHWEQLNRRNIKLSDVFYLLRINIVDQPAHGPKSVPNGTVDGDENDDTSQGQLGFKEIALACQAMETAAAFNSVIKEGKGASLPLAVAKQPGGEHSSLVSPNENSQSAPPAPNTASLGAKASDQKKKKPKVSKKASTATGERGETNFGWPPAVVADAIQKVYLDKVSPKEFAQS